MKQIKFITSIAIITLLFSCSDEFLSPKPTAAVSAENAYTTELQLEEGVINMYDAIQGVNALADTDINKNHAIQIEFYLTEMRSDNTRTKSQEGEAAQFDTFNVKATNGIVNDYYRSFYNVIFRANIVLSNLDIATTEEKKTNVEAEAKFVRAYAYFNLVRLFGDIPLVDKPLELLDKDPQFTRVETSKVYDLIVSDLKAAVAGLDNTYKNRASKAAAQALLAKVYLTLGTDYAQARALCEAVMTDGAYDLEANFKDVFYNENNKEIIFAIGFIADNSLNSQNFSAEWLNGVGRTSGVNYVTTEAKDALDALGGDRTQFSYRQDTKQNTQYQVVKYLPNGDGNLGIEATSSNSTLGGNDWIVLRFADVLLMHVEAIMAGGNTTSDSFAITSFQKVRDRAGLPTAVTAISRQELLDERRVELAFENHRLFDLIRLKEAQSVLSAFSTSNGYGFSATDLLLPLPQNEINLSDGKLKQNPGY